MLFFMTKRLPGDSGRRFAFTDRKNGYLELSCSAAATGEGGYFRDSRKYLSDFFLSSGGGSADLYRTNASRTDISPDGISILFNIDDTEIRLEISLLFDEQALYVSVRGDPKIGLGIVLAGDHVWQESVLGGITLFTNDDGAAVASRSPFRLDTAGNGVIVLFSGDTDPSWYLVFEDDPEAARVKAASLTRDDAIDIHRAGTAVFFAGFRSESGTAEFDEALRQAQFSGWMLASDGSHPGIRSGFPFTREYRGRNAFVALPGILLASGRFSEARALLAAAAGDLSHTLRDTDVSCAITGLLFVRALWDYVRYTGAVSDALVLRETVTLILDTARRGHTDDRGFLLHADDETLTESHEPCPGIPVPRGDRACEMQALWYTALCIGARLARLDGDDGTAEDLSVLAVSLKKSFNTFFWSASRNALVDHLTEGTRGERIPDFQVRPDQLSVITVPSVLYGDDSGFTGKQVRTAIVENVRRELVTPFGLHGLCPDDPFFDPDPDCRDGRIEVRHTGSFISAAAEESAGMDPLSSDLLLNEAQMILSAGCAGTLAETSGTGPWSGSYPEPGGYRSHAPAVAEFIRNVFQDIIGFRPYLAENRIEIHPRLPDWADAWKAECPFGPGWKLNVRLERTPADNTPDNAGILCVISWNAGVLPAPSISLLANGKPLVPGRDLSFVFPAASGRKKRKNAAGYRLESFPVAILPCRRYGAGETGCLPGSFFDSARFGKTYNTVLRLGALWSREETVFRLWAPTARSVSLVIFRDGTAAAPSVRLPMRCRSGIWEITLSGDQNGTYYCFSVRVHGIVRDSPDPYARACGVNGKRSMVVDFARTNPEGWNELRSPALDSPNDAIVYEMHVADLTSSPSWNGDPSLRRTYAGAARSGTSTDGIPTGFDHIKSLGVTHVQLMPVFDFVSVDESRLEDGAYAVRPVGGLFNWGYDPLNWSVPEGSYSTNPFDGAVRIRELKTLVGAFLANGIGVIMDVVYNHVPSAPDHPFGICVPGYYFRDENCSGAGDDTASERAMFRSFMVDSLCFWLTEYKLSGFRFDLMGLHDIGTMNAAAAALRKIKPDVLLYGEGWDMYRGTKMVGATMREARKLEGIGFFNDAFRCGIKGSIFAADAGGFIHDGSHRESVKFGLVGAVYHPGVHNSLVDGTANPNPWTGHTASSVNYTEIHDNLTLHDKLVLVENGRSEAYYSRLQRTAVALVLFAQGQPVLHAGMEFMRTKEIPADLLAGGFDIGDLYWTVDRARAFSHNSYNLCDRINGLDWNRCVDKKDMVAYVRNLVAVRKAHPLFRLRTAAEVVSSLTFIEGGPGASGSSILAWRIDGAAAGDSWKSACVIVNPAHAAAEFSLPACTEGMRWHLVTDGDEFRAGESAVPGTGTSETVASIAPKALYLYAEF